MATALSGAEIGRHRNVVEQGMAFDDRRGIGGQFVRRAVDANVPRHLPPAERHREPVVMIRPPCPQLSRQVVDDAQGSGDRRRCGALVDAAGSVLGGDLLRKPFPFALRLGGIVSPASPITDAPAQRRPHGGGKPDGAEDEVHRVAEDDGEQHAACHRQEGGEQPAGGSQRMRRVGGRRLDR